MFHDPGAKVAGVQGLAGKKPVKRPVIGGNAGKKGKKGKGFCKGDVWGRGRNLGGTRSCVMTAL